MAPRQIPIRQGAMRHDLGGATRMKRAMRILVVDDNPQDRALVVRELRSEFPSAEIWQAVDQQQLDTLLRETQLDLVVTDYQLHWSDGIVVLNRVKAQWPNCPVIMFTATGNEEVAVDGMRQGLDDYIIKNVKHLVRLRTATRTVIDHAATKKRAEELASRLGSLLSQLRVGVFSCRADGTILDQNQAMRELVSSLGRESGDSLAALFANDPRVGQLLEQAGTSETPHECEFSVVDRNDVRRDLRLSVSRGNGSGASDRIDGLLEDVTQRKQTEAEVRAAEVAAAKIDMLSPRENQVLHEVCRGHANKVIARNLDISEKTVEKHRASLMKKLRVRSVAELVRMAVLAEAV